MGGWCKIGEILSTWLLNAPLSNVLILLNILGSGEDEDLLFDDDDNHEDLIRLMEHDSDLENDDTGSDSTTSSQGIDR